MALCTHVTDRSHKFKFKDEIVLGISYKIKIQIKLI